MDIRITVATIGIVGTITAAIIYNFCDIFPGYCKEEAWNLELALGDDILRAYINGKRVEECTLNIKCSVDLNQYLEPGENTLEVKLENYGGPYAFGVVLSKNGKVVSEDHCGGPIDGRKECARFGEKLIFPEKRVFSKIINF